MNSQIGKGLLGLVRRLSNHSRREANPVGSACRVMPFLQAFDYRSDDVVLVGYPKSGNTWLRFIMANLVSDSMPHGSQEVDWLQTQRIVPALSKDADRRAQPDYELLPSPRILHSHSLYTPRFPKVIYIMRDGRDVMVSYYYHFKKFAGFQGTLLDFLIKVGRGTGWDEHLNSWICQNPSLVNFCVVRYEDMLRDPLSEVKKLVRFAGLGSTDEQIRQAVTNSSFDNMRQLEENKGLGYVQPRNTQIRFMRKGRSGDWREEFGEKEKAAFKHMCGDMLIKMGYEASFQW